MVNWAAEHKGEQVKELLAKLVFSTSAKDVSLTVRLSEILELGDICQGLLQPALAKQLEKLGIPKKPSVYVSGRLTMDKLKSVERVVSIILFDDSNVTIQTLQELFNVLEVGGQFSRVLGDTFTKALTHLGVPLEAATAAKQRINLGSPTLVKYLDEFLFGDALIRLSALDNILKILSCPGLVRLAEDLLQPSVWDRLVSCGVNKRLATRIAEAITPAQVPKIRVAILQLLSPCPTNLSNALQNLCCALFPLDTNKVLFEVERQAFSCRLKRAEVDGELATRISLQLKSSSNFEYVHVEVLQVAFGSMADVGDVLSIMIDKLGLVDATDLKVVLRELPFSKRKAIEGVDSTVKQHSQSGLRETNLLLQEENAVLRHQLQRRTSKRGLEDQDGLTRARSAPAPREGYGHGQAADRYYSKPHAFDSLIQDLAVGQRVWRRDHGKDWGVGYVVSLDPLRITVNDNPKGKGYAYDEVQSQGPHKAFAVGQRVQRRDRGKAWRPGYVVSLDPLRVTADPDPAAKGFAWEEVRPVEDQQVFTVGQHVQRRDQGAEWGTGYVVSVEPLHVTMEDDAAGKGYPWDEIRPLESPAVMNVSTLSC